MRMSTLMLKFLCGLLCLYKPKKITIGKNNTGPENKLEFSEKKSTIQSNITLVHSGTSIVVITNNYLNLFNPLHKMETTCNTAQVTKNLRLDRSWTEGKTKYYCSAKET